MKLRSFILTAIAMLLLSTSTFAEVTISFDGNDLIAHSDQEGVEGFKGCHSSQLEKIPAYTFRLLQKERVSNNATCKVPSGKWRQRDEQTSENGSVLFKNLPEGEYKVLCLTGKAIGCEINGVPEGYPNRSIVYAQETSGITSSGASEQRTASSNIKNSIQGSLLVFPNPSEDEINIQIKHPKMKGEAVLTIYDMQGKQLYMQNYMLDQKANGTWKVSTFNYSSGTYLIRMVDADGVSVEGKFQIVQSE